MRKTTRIALTLGIAGLMAAIPSMAQEKASTDNNDAAMAAAIRFERAKQVADQRQAKIEAQQPCGCATPEDAQRTAMGIKPEQKTITTATAKPKK